MNLSTRLVFICSFSLLWLTACAPGRSTLATLTLESTPSPEPVFPTTQATATQLIETWQQLDLRFAHVLEVSYTPLSEAQVRFDVTLVHDDESEAPEYADWWQVEDLSADVLGMRILTHSHGSQPFTRSDTIDIPAGVELVIIRGHDMRHGFGGQAIQLNLVTGEQITLMPTQ